MGWRITSLSWHSGEHPVPSKYFIRNSCLFRLDLAGRTVFDQRPRFPIPQELHALPIQIPPPALQYRLFELESKHPQLLPLLRALEMMSSISEMINRHGHSSLFWENEVAAIHMLGPATHHLLSSGRIVDSDAATADCLIVAESARLACLILISGLKRRFSLNASDMGPLQAKYASVVARDVGELDGPLAHLSLWALVSAALLLSNDMRMHLLPRIRAVMKSQGLPDSRAAFESAKEIIWMDNMEITQEAQLADEIDGDTECSPDRALVHAFNDFSSQDIF